MLLFAGLVVAASLGGVRWVDTTVGIAVVLQAMVPLAAFLVAALVAVCAVTRRWRLAIASGVLLAACGTLAVPSVFGPTVASGPGDLVVMTSNLQYGSADAGSLVVAVRQHRVDVLVLLEVTPAAVERLRAAGLDTLLPETAGRSSRDAGGTILRGRTALTLVDPNLDQVSAHAFDEPAVSTRYPGGTVVVRAVHSLPPGLSGAADWRSGLAGLHAWVQRQPTDEPLVLAGDFNSSWGHPGFRQVAETMTDAHRAAGQGWVRTRPQGRRLIRPFIQLDHVLVRGLDVVDAGEIRLPNTDHAAVWARLSPHGP